MIHEAVPVHAQRPHTPCLRSRLLDQHQLSSWLMLDSPTSAWELPRVQGPSHDNGSRSCGFHFRASAPRHPASKCLSVPPQVPAVYLRCHLAKRRRGSHLPHCFLN